MGVSRRFEDDASWPALGRLAGSEAPKADKRYSCSSVAVLAGDQWA